MGGMCVVILGMVLVLVGCVNEKGICVLFFGDEGLDEFVIMLIKELVVLVSYFSLLELMLGGINFVDVDLLVEGVVVLGGNCIIVLVGLFFFVMDSVFVSYVFCNGMNLNICE